MATKKKNSAALEMVRLRMEKLSPEQRSAIAKHASDAAHGSMTEEARTERARKAAAARWGTKKQPVKSTKKATTKK